MVDTKSHNMVPALNRLEVQGDLETETISRYTKAEKFQKPAFPSRRGSSCSSRAVPYPAGAITSVTIIPRLAGRNSPQPPRKVARAGVIAVAVSSRRSAVSHGQRTKYNGQTTSSQLLRTCRRITGQDENYRRDRAFMVRKEAQEALDLMGTQ